jgi:hypothetical protein
LGKIQIGQEVFDLATYPVLERKILGIWQNQRDLYDVTNLSNESVNDLSILPNLLTHYFLAFTVYALAQVSDTTPNYRTSFYSDIFDKIILMMNSSAIEQYEWNNRGYNSEYYADLGNGFRGPNNIMWAGHYVLMELLYYNLFRDPKYLPELTHYLDQWNISLTATVTWDNKTSMDNEGRPLGVWGTGLIPCEPYIVFVQCNSIPMYAMQLYDNLHQTTFRGATEPGLEWWQEHMTDENGNQIDGYYIYEPFDSTASFLDPADPNARVLEIPGPAKTIGKNVPKVASYGSTWVSMFYQAMGETEIAAEYYDAWKRHNLHYTSNDMAFSPDSYHKPNSFQLFDLVGTIFSYVAAREMGDWESFRKVENYFFNPFPSYWDGYQYKFDSTILGSILGPLFHPVFNMAYSWGHAGSNLKDLIHPRHDSFFSLPYISEENTTKGLFVYQAFYDEDRKAFILTVEANDPTQLTFENFPNIEGVYTESGTYDKWSQRGNQMLLRLDPGTYSFVIR